MNIGQLRTKVELLAEGEVERDAYNVPKPIYTHFAYAWAKVEPLQSNEQFKAQQLQGQPTYKLSMRYVPGLSTAHMVVLPDGKRLDITSVVNVGMSNTEHEVMAKETT